MSRIKNIKTRALGERRCLRAALAGSLLCGGSLVAVVIGGSLPASAQPSVSFYVVSGGAGTGDCSSLANACASIQTAVTTTEDGAYNGDDVTIVVGAGTYTESDTIDASSLNSLTIAGAGASTTTVSGGGTSGPLFTIVNGTVAFSDIAIDNAFYQTYAEGAGIDACDGRRGSGGASDCAVTVTDGNFVNDQAVSGGAWSDGGAIAVATEGGGTGSLTVTDSTFTDDTGQTSGGAIDICDGVNGSVDTGCILNVTGSTFTGNSSFYGASAINSGGGNGTESATATVTDSTFADGSPPAISSGAGAGGSGSLTVTGSTFSGNNNEEDPVYGGAIDNGDGGSGTATVTDSTFVDNEVSAVRGGAGGAIANGINGTGTLTVNDSTFVGNAAQSGGAIVNAGTNTARITGSTFSGNSGTNTDGGGITNGGGTVDLGDSIVANSDSSGGDCAGTITDEGYNVDSDGTCGLSATGSISDSSTLDASLGTLQNNGGPTQTIAPSATSPAVGVIPNPTTVNSVPVCGNGATDQTGASAPLPDQADCTIGAVQVGVVTLYVVSGGAGTGDCSSLANACASIQTAITTAENGSYNGDDVTIDVAASATAYTEDVSISASSLRSLTIAGAGALSTTVNGGGSHSVFTVISGTVILSGLTITNGGGNDGGGIDTCDGTSDCVVTITDATISGNTTSGDGGAIDNADNGGSGTLTVSGSTISGNTAGYDGGGIDNGDQGGSSGTLTVTDSTISGNMSGNRNSDAVSGGAIANGNNGGTGTANISGSTISTNRASCNGGAIDNGDQGGSSGTLTVTGSAITGNTSSSCSGGGILTGAEGGTGTATVTHSTVSGNNALFAGGIGDGENGCGSGNGALTVIDSTISGNTVSGPGGGLDIGDYGGCGTATVTGSTISGNKAGNGGGIDIADNCGCSTATATVTNSTIAGNTASGNGGAIDVGDDGGGNGTATVTDSTIRSNSATNNGGGIDNAGGTAILGATIVAESPSGGDCSGTVTDEGYNIADDPSCGFTATGSTNSSATLDADLGPLQNNGGPTDTMALLPGSPAIDQVTSGSGLCPATDQRGAPRTAPCDIGAYDTDWGPAVTIDILGSQTSGGTALLSYTTNAPGGIISGTLTCATVDSGTIISSGLPVGTYTVDGSSCSGLTSSDQADYPVFPSSYVGVTNGFAVSTITSVSFGGSAASPTVTVAGDGFGTLADLGTPQNSCGTGSDYATNLYLTDTTKFWGAGEGPPSGSDCIGLIITSYTPTDIVFTFGSQYGTGSDVLTGGDSYTVNLLGSTFFGTDMYYAYPVVSEVSPVTGFTTGTTPVTITGTGFTGATAVDFGGVPATNVMVVNDTTITAESPPGSAGPPVDVTVTGPGGLSATSPADQYTYTVDQTTPQTVTCTTSCPTNTVTSPLNQTVVSVAPVAPENNATTSLTVNTDTFSCGASKTHNYDYTAAVSTLSATGFARKAALTVTETVGNEPTTAGVQVCFGTGPNPTKGKFLKKCKRSMKAPCLESLTESSGSVIATFLSPATDPRFWTGEAAADLSSFSPTKGAPGSTVTIKGTNLNGVIAVVIGGASATISTASTASELVVTVPEKATVGTGLITVTSASGQAVSVKKFTVT
jgi:hypothetical protein